jgi:acetylornithine deacetylase/succinyl-diaminopimelate desuccinylase-like protein
MIAAAPDSATAPSDDLVQRLMRLYNALVQIAARIEAQDKRIAELERDKDQWRDLYITALDKARGYRGIDNDSTLADALQTLVDMRLSTESNLADALQTLVAQDKQIAELEREISARSDLMQGYLDCWRKDEARAERAEAENAELRACVEAALA